jgi:hypothetical membrane protein
MTTRACFIFGSVAGPLFLLVTLIQDYTRSAFDPRVHALSLLSLGEWGWVQVINFVVAGALNLIYARGLWKQLERSPAATAVKLSISVYGLGLIVLGLFRTDPSNGFPPGSVPPLLPSWNGLVHGFAALFVFVSLAVSLVAFWRVLTNQGEGAWAAYALGSSIVVVVLFFAGVSHPSWLPRALRLATLAGWMAPAMIALKLAPDQ